MSSDANKNIAIKVENLSKCYHIYDKPHDRLKQMILPRLQRLNSDPPKTYYREFWALKDVSFEVKKGETVGIIGRNGSGKSTLLQMICGTLNPTSGSVATNGRIAALLELGSGFNPEFTGRENVYLNASVLGLSKEEIDARFDDIAAFADIGEYLEQSVKTYSSGMVVRLAFAVSASINPDILVVDEAIAVGDAKFQAKCFERLRSLKEQGTSILLVTHSSDQIVTHCNSAILLDNGLQLESGEPKHVVNRYMDLLFGKGKKDTVIEHVVIKPNQDLEPFKTESLVSVTDERFTTRPNYNPHEYRWGDRTAAILDFCLAVEQEVYPVSIQTGQTISLLVSIRFNTAIFRPILGLTIKTKEGIHVYGVNSETLDCVEFMQLGKAGSVVVASMQFACILAQGDYFISLGIASKHGEEVIPHDRRYDAIHFQVVSNTQFFGLCDMRLAMSAEECFS